MSFGAAGRLYDNAAPSTSRSRPPARGSPGLGVGLLAALAPREGRGLGRDVHGDAPAGCRVNAEAPGVMAGHPARRLAPNDSPATTAELGILSAPAGRRAEPLRPPAPAGRERLSTARPAKEPWFKRAAFGYGPQRLAGGRLRPGPGSRALQRDHALSSSPTRTTPRISSSSALVAVGVLPAPTAWRSGNIGCFWLSRVMR
jgi:hypothetical protein